MLHWLSFILIPSALVAGIYVVTLLNRLRSRFKLDYLNSFFYFELLLVLFGLYGILGSLGMRHLLESIEIGGKQMEVVVQFIPFLGVPFIIAAWYMSLKMAGELVGKKVPQWIAVTYFILCTLAFLLYGLVIRRMPEITPDGYENLRQKIRLVFFSIELGIVAYISVFILSRLAYIQDYKRKQMLQRFVLILAATTLLSTLTQYYAEHNTLVFLYFLVLFFAGDLPLVLLLKAHLENTPALYQRYINREEDIYQRYGISKREREIIREICRGKTNQQIADNLFITLQTVKDHNHHIYQKTGVSNRVQLARIFSVPSEIEEHSSNDKNN